MTTLPFGDRDPEKLWVVIVAIIIAIAVMCTACGRTSLNGHTMSPEGEIVEVKQGTDMIIIKVQFGCEEDEDVYYLTLKGDNTCKVGQKVRIHYD